MNRQQIHDKIRSNLAQIESLENENIELERQSLLLSDEYQRFEEKIESHPKTRGQKKRNYLDGKLVGRVYWKSTFLDEDTGEVLTFDRQRIVRVDGEWV